MNRDLANARIALEAVLGNKVRSGLTALGIIFGVASVIAMMAVGRGTQAEILQQFELIGANNIIIEPLLEDGNRPSDEPSFSEGLHLDDAQSFADILPSVESVSPEIEVDTRIVREGISQSGRVIGVTEEYFQLNKFGLTQGSLFTSDQIRRGERVCVIGASVARKFFREEDVVGESIKCGRVWLQVVGVLDARNITEAAQANLGIRDYDADIYVPLQTVLLRFENRALVTNAILGRRGDDDEDEEGNGALVNYHQLDRVTLRISDPNLMASSAEVLSRLLQRRHNGAVDFVIRIPIDKLEQQRQASRTFSMVLLLIAAISLVVGGIGIMNIMLASVLERIKEIGLRLSVGATKKDIVTQFLLEAVVMCLGGGLLGVFLGIGSSLIIEQAFGIRTIVSIGSILAAFGISAAIGVLFGWLPANRAAKQDPIKSLRYES